LPLKQCCASTLVETLAQSNWLWLSRKATIY
jgi:hypothetical protein